MVVAGLDPAYPGFSMDNTDARLDVTDAEFVDIIHTNSALLFSGGLSFPTPIGHADFWPNGGSDQPVKLFELIAKTKLLFLFSQLVILLTCGIFYTCKGMFGINYLQPLQSCDIFYGIDQCHKAIYVYQMCNPRRLDRWFVWTEGEHRNGIFRFYIVSPFFLTMRDSYQS
jgi:hypothetical protein